MARSATAYPVREEDRDAILQTVAYHPRDFDLAAIWFSPREHLGIRPSISTSFQQQQQRASSNDAVGLGVLDRLPPELWSTVLRHLDMYSLFRLRQANTRSRRAVDALGEYQRAVAHGLNAFCALLRTRLAIHVSLADFYRALCTKECALCGAFGGFVSLPTWTRCCSACIVEAPETLVQDLSAVRGQYRLDDRQVSQLRTFEVLPGLYTLLEAPQRSRATVASVRQAMLVAGLPPPPPYVRPARRVARALRSGFRVFNYAASCALPFYDEKAGRADDGVSCAGCQLVLQRRKRFLTQASRKRWAHDAQGKVYARDDFLEHFRWCKEAQRLWESSDGGAHQPAELPEAARRGGFLERE